MYCLTKYLKTDFLFQENGKELILQYLITKGTLEAGSAFGIKTEIIYWILQCKK